MLRAGLLSLLTLAGVALVDPPAEVQPALTPAQAESLAQKLDGILRAAPSRDKGPAPTPLVVTESELNSYINFKLRPKFPDGLSQVVLRLERDRLSGSALVDFDRVKGRLPALGPLNPLSLLSGQVPAEFSGRFPNQDGFGTVELEQARLGPLSLPISLVEQAVASSTRNADNPQGVDLHAPFRLPYSIRRVRLQPGRALVEY